MKKRHASKLLALLIAVLVAAALFPTVVWAEGPEITKLVYDNTEGEEPSIAIEVTDKSGKKEVEIYGLKELAEGEEAGPMGKVETEGKTWGISAIQTVNTADKDTFNDNGEGSIVVKTKLYTEGAENKPRAGEKITVVYESGETYDNMTMSKGVEITVPKEGESVTIDLSAEPVKPEPSQTPVDPEPSQTPVTPTEPEKPSEPEHNQNDNPAAWKALHQPKPSPEAAAEPSPPTSEQLPDASELLNQPEQSAEPVEETPKEEPKASTEAAVGKEAEPQPSPATEQVIESNNGKKYTIRPAGSNEEEGENKGCCK